MDQMRQNDNIITGELWEKFPNTDYAFVSNKGRYGYLNDTRFPYRGVNLCTEQELKDKINFLENVGNILNEAEGYTNVDYYQQWKEV